MRESARRRWLACAPLLALLCSCATPSTPFEGHAVLAAIHFEGNKSISDGDLLARISTAPTSGFFSKTARYYDADLFQIDEKRLLRWYNEKGFYEARIEEVREARDDKGRVTLTVVVHEGPRAKVRRQTLELKPPALIPEQEQRDLLGKLPLKEGDDFDEDRYTLGKAALLLQLKEHGFARADVDGNVRVRPDEGEAEIVYTVDSGPRYTFGRVLVSGNRAVNAEQIIRATGIDRGDPFKQSSLDLAQQRVYNLGAFSGVRVSLEPLGDNPVAAVRVNVREAPFKTVRVGLGFVAEQERYEIPRLRGEYTNRNLFGGLRRLELATQLGYAFTPTLTTPAGPVTLTTASLTTPNVLLPGLDFIVRGDFAREVQVGLTYDEAAARVSFLWRRGYHAIAPSLNLVQYFDSALAGGVDIATLINKGGSSAATLVTNTSCLPSCRLFYPEIRYTFDLRDNVLEPHRGFYFSISVQQTLKPGTFTYFRIEPEARAYLPLWGNSVAAGRVYWGALVLPPGTDQTASPFQQRFFGGGYSGNRGFAPQGQSPRFGTGYNQQGYATDSVPVGGNGDFQLSGELRLDTGFILAHTMVVPFFDASRVTVSPKLPFTVPLELAPGLGLRYLTPFGPIRLDVGYLLHSFEQVALAPPQTASFPQLLNPQLQSTPVSTSCDSSTGRCIGLSHFAFHLALGEAY